MSDIVTETGVLNLGKKKSKKHVGATQKSLSSTENIHKLEATDANDAQQMYTMLLDRIYETLKVRNPELTGELKKTILCPPQVAREGTKRTVFINFQELCKTMNRCHEHVMQFMLSELGASGSLDGAKRLVVKGRFLPKAFENILRRYMLEYVLCTSCKSPETRLDKNQNTRLTCKTCNRCGAARSVSIVKTGFQARVTSRKAERATIQK